MNIVLIGPRGVGKSNIARRLAFALKRPVMSTDVLVEYDNGGVSIADQVAADGGDWRAFREREYQVVRKVAAMDGLIVDAGGGVVVDLDPDGHEVFSDRKVGLLRGGGRIVYLAGDIARLAAKVSGDPRRPTLVAGVSAEQAMRHRLPYYQRAADLTIDVEGRDRAEIAEEIAAQFRTA